MRTPVVAVVYLALAGCATCPQPVVTTAPTALYTRLYSLHGAVVSALAKGQLTGQQAIALSAQLNAAQADLQKDATLPATATMDAVQAALKQEPKP